MLFLTATLRTSGSPVSQPISGDCAMIHLANPRICERPHLSPVYAGTVLLLMLWPIFPSHSAVLFHADFETGKSVVFEAVKPGDHTIQLAPCTAVSQWPEKDGIGVIEGNFPARSEEFSYARRRGETLSGVRGITALHPRFCPIQTSTLKNWGPVGYTSEARDFISLRRAGALSDGYSACISMASPLRTSLQRYSTPAAGRLIRFTFMCSRELLAPASGMYFRFFELNHDDYNLPALALTKGRKNRSARIHLYPNRTRRLDTPGGPFSRSAAIVEPDSLYTVDYQYQIVSGDTARMSLRVNGALLDSALMVCIPALKTPRYYYRIGKLREISLPGTLYLDNIIETTLPPSLPPATPLLSQSGGSLSIPNAPSGSYEAQWQITRNNTWVTPHFFTSPRADFFPSLCIPHTARFYLFNDFLAVPVYANSHCTPWLRDKPPAFSYTVAHPRDTSLLARVRIRKQGSVQWGGWSMPRAFQPATVDTLPVGHAALPPVPSIRIRSGSGLPFVQSLPRVRRGRFFTIDLTAPHGAPADTVYSTDIWLSSVESDAAGGYANRGGPFDSTAQYVISVSFHNNSLWARLRHGSLLFTVLDDSSDAYLSYARSTIDTRRARARLAIALPDYVHRGLWTVSAYNRNRDAVCSPVRTELFVLADEPPFGILPLSAGLLLIAVSAAGGVWIVYARRSARRHVNRTGRSFESSINTRVPALPDAAPHKHTIESALSYIRTNYMEGISPHDVARECNISADWLGKLFKKSMGVTVVNYLTHVRLEQAALLLKGSELNVAEICYRVGYKNPNYFSKAFTKHAGLSPRDYRKKHRTD